MTAKPDFSITIPSQTRLLKMVVELTRHIATLAQFPAPEAQRISLAIDEAVTNVIKHSYGGRDDEELSIEYFLLANGIRIRIAYRGLAPDISDEKIDITRMIKSKSKGGLGVRLMKTIMDSVQYTSSAGRHSCELTKWQKAK